MSGNRRSEIYDNVEDLCAATSVTLVSSVSSILWLLAASLICSLTGVPGGEAGQAATDWLVASICVDVERERCSAACRIFLSCHDF